jgi:hypothetical protein
MCVLFRRLTPVSTSAITRLARTSASAHPAIFSTGTAALAAILTNAQAVNTIVRYLYTYLPVVPEPQEAAYFCIGYKILVGFGAGTALTWCGSANADIYSSVQHLFLYCIVLHIIGGLSLVRALFLYKRTVTKFSTVTKRVLIAYWNPLCIIVQIS